MELFIKPKKDPEPVPVKKTLRKAAKTRVRKTRKNKDK
jgi:hypothetical protein